MLEKCSSAASFSSAVASCSCLRFLDARRAWRKTSTCGEQAWVLEATLARQGRQAKEKQESKAVMPALLETGWEEGRGVAGAGSQSNPGPHRALTSDLPRDCCTSFRNSSWCSASSRWPSKIWHQMIPERGQNWDEEPALWQSQQAKGQWTAGTLSCVFVNSKSGMCSW